MEKSIESIWKQGFLNSDVLVAPKLNNLYNRKSIHSIDTYQYMYGFLLYRLFTFGAIKASLFKKPFFHIVSIDFSI